MVRYFRFYDEEKEQSHYLELTGPEELLNKQPEDIDEIFDNILQPEMERRELETKFGVHDVSFGMETLTLWGFTTYEVESKQWFTLMLEWRQILQLAGFEVGAYFIKKEDAEQQL